MNAFTVLKKTLLYFIPPILIIGGIMSAYYFKDLREERRFIQAKEKLHVNMLEEEISDTLKNIADDLRLLSSHFELEAFLSAENNPQLDALIKEFIAFSELKKIFDQIRLIDQSGMETIRINYDNGRAIAAPHETLQNKREHYYFNEIQKITKGKIYLSPFDLGAEDHAREQPVKPNLRIGAPLFDPRGRRKGMLILNVLSDFILQRLEEYPSKEISRHLLVGSDTFYFCSPEKGSAWKLIDKDQAEFPFQSRYPKIAEQAAHETSGQFLTEKGLVTFATIFPYKIIKGEHPPRSGKENTGEDDYKTASIYWKLISIVPSEFLNERPKEVLNRLFLIFFLFTLVLGFGSFSLAKTNLRRSLSDEELVKSEERYRQLVENTLYAVEEIDTAGNILFANDSYHRMLGYLPGELVGRNIVEIIPPESRDGVKSCIATLLSGRKEHTLSEGRLIKKDGRIIDVEVAKNAKRGNQGKITGFISVITDISERKEAEKEIEKALSEKEVLLREIHHRVKNNLQIIRSLLYLQSKSVQGERDREYFKEAQERVQTMALVHEQLYQSEHIVKVHFAEYINSLVKILTESYNVDEKRIMISSNLEGITLGVDLAIPCGLIVNELLTNVFKHAFPGNRKGKVAIDCHAMDEDRFEIRIRDDGVGLPDGFDLKNSNTLGLRLVSLLVEQVEGEITLEKARGTAYNIVIQGEVS